MASLKTSDMHSNTCSIARKPVPVYTDADQTLAVYGFTDYVQGEPIPAQQSGSDQLAMPGNAVIKRKPVPPKLTEKAAFATLPPELRLMIWKAAAENMIAESRVIVLRKSKKARGLMTPKCTGFPLLGACVESREVVKEYLNLHYQLTNFGSRLDNPVLFNPNRDVLYFRKQSEFCRFVGVHRQSGQLRWNLPRALDIVHHIYVEDRILKDPIGTKLAASAFPYLATLWIAHGASCHSWFRHKIEHDLMIMQHIMLQTRDNGFPLDYQTPTCMFIMPGQLRCYGLVPKRKTIHKIRDFMNRLGRDLQLLFCLR